MRSMYCLCWSSLKARGKRLVLVLSKEKKLTSRGSGYEASSFGAFMIDLLSLINLSVFIDFIKSTAFNLNNNKFDKNNPNEKKKLFVYLALNVIYRFSKCVSEVPLEIEWDEINGYEKAEYY